MKTRLTFLLLIFLWLAQFILRAQAPPQIHALDVGQGSSVLITTRNSNGNTDSCAVLVDAGGSSVGPTIMRYLDSLGIRRLIIFVTHFHNDHIGGLVGTQQHMGLLQYHLTGQLTIDAIYDRGDVNTAGSNPFGNYWNLIQQSQLTNRQIDRRVLDPGTSILPFNVFGNNEIILEVLAINGRVAGVIDYFPVTNENDRSLVLRLRYHVFTFILAGDLQGIMRQTETCPLQYSYSNTPYGAAVSNVIGAHSCGALIPHHGANNGFLGFATLGFAVIQSGCNERFAHPRQAPLDYITNILAAYIFCTALNHYTRTTSDNQNQIRTQFVGGHILVEVYPNGGWRMLFYQNYYWTTDGVQRNCHNHPNNN